MNLNTDKTKCISFRTKQCRKLINPTILIEDNEIELIDHSKFLGLILDCNLSWDLHVASVLKKINSGLYAIKKMFPLCSLETLKLIYFAHVHSHIAYGISVYGATKKENLNEILKVQKKAIRTMLKLGYNESVKDHFKSLNILTVFSLYIFQSIMFIKENNICNNVSLEYVKHNYNTRNKKSFNLQHHRLELFKKKPEYAGNKFLSTLPLYIKKETDSKIFKNKLKNYLISLALYSVEEYEELLQI